MVTQTAIELGELSAFPPTVNGATSHTTGWQLHTIDRDEDTDIFAPDGADEWVYMEDTE